MEDGSAPVGDVLASFGAVGGSGDAAAVFIYARDVDSSASLIHTTSYS